ncbi:MAG: integrase [Lysobacteraceae bacterium]|nr:MAG: integrase [Xanthomonadaceae bacterium]
MPITEEPRYAGFVARMMEITSTQAPWHRRLWRSGTMQIARELLDESVRPGVREAAVSDQRTYLTHSLQADHGIADRGNCVRDTIKYIKPEITEMSHAWINLREHVDRMHDSYLRNWADAFDAPPTGNRPIDVEGAARRITAHILDAGMHKSSLYAWLRAIQADTSSSITTLGDFLRAADEMLRKPERVYTFCVPVETKPRFRIDALSAPGWMTSGETSDWKRRHAPKAPNTRHQGSFLLTAKAHDVNAAAEKVRSVISSLATKFQLGASNPIVVCPRMWSMEKNSEFPTQATNRIVSMRSFERLDRIQELAMLDYITNTLALVQPLRTSAPHIAVMSGWSAIESLMVGPSDDQDVVAAKRFSLIVAASMVRAELSWLSRSYAKAHDDAAALEMRGCDANIARARLFQMHACANPQIDLGIEVDNLALMRIRPVLANPRQEVEKITDILTREFTRLYRKRNMIVHGGQIHESNLHSISEVLAPLIGAGIDRVINVGLKTGVRPIELSAIAESRVHYLTPASESDPGNLLNLLEFA